jgi:hypothetical protein
MTAGAADRPESRCLQAKEALMKSSNTLHAHKPEPSPSKGQVGDRPDNGSRSSRGAGPTSGARLDNPHKRIRLTGHGRAH